MTQASAPITQDVLTIPRKLPETGLTNIVGLSRDALRAALIAGRHARETGQDAG